MLLSREWILKEMNVQNIRAKEKEMIEFSYQNKLNYTLKMNPETVFADYVIFQAYDDYKITIITRIFYSSSGLLFFLWLLTDPIFKKVLTSLVCCCSKKNESTQDVKHFEALMDKYQNTNSFLFSSLNMEIVYSILKGINVIVREFNTNESEALTDQDFQFCKCI